MSLRRHDLRKGRAKIVPEFGRSGDSEVASRRPRGRLEVASRWPRGGLEVASSLGAGKMFDFDKIVGMSRAIRSFWRADFGCPHYDFVMVES